MHAKRFIAAALAAASLTAIPGLSSAQSVIYVETAPPPLQYEVIPAPRAGYVWSRGYWAWDGSRYVWREGHWVEARSGYTHYVAPNWHSRDGRWYFQDGRWYNHRDDLNYAWAWEPRPNPIQTPRF